MSRKRFDGASLASKVCVLAVCAITSGCGSDEQRGSTGNPTVTDPVDQSSPAGGRWSGSTELQAEGHTLCGAYSVGQSDLGPEFSLETYSGPVMNEKLASFPEFAEAIGMTRVSTCDEARAFMKAYNDYRSIHPWFDEDLLSKDELLRQWEAEGLIDLEPEFLELAGVPDNVNLSVVRTVRQPTKEELQLDPLLKGTTSCTAVRIAPLLFLTAAHCLPNVQRDVQLKTFQMWIKHVTAAGTYKYYVSGSAFPPTEPFVVDGMVLPGFAGTNDAPRDLAVFRIREGKEALLADNVPETIARISSRTPKLGDPVDALGWGRATETDNLEDTILRISDQPLTIPQPVSDVITIPYVGVSAPNSVRICNGDSGGPLRLAANENVVGLLSASQFFSPSLPTQCAKAGDAQYWTRVDVRINDIKKMMSTLQSGTMKAPYRCFFHSAVEQPRDAENIGSYFDCARQ